MIFNIDWRQLFLPSVPLFVTFLRGTLVYLALFALLRLGSRLRVKCAYMEPWWESMWEAGLVRVMGRYLQKCSIHGIVPRSGSFRWF